MRIWVAGQARDADLGVAVQRTAAGLRCPDLEARLVREAPLLSLAAPADARSLGGRHIEMLRSRCAVNLSTYAPPAAEGWRGRTAQSGRRLLVRCVRHVLEWLTFRHNVIHRQLVRALEFERAERLALEKRLAALESGCTRRPPAEPKA